MSDTYSSTPPLPAFAAPTGGGQVTESFGQGVPEPLPQKCPKKIAATLTEFKESPKVSVNLKEVHSYFIDVPGEVKKPGKFPLTLYASVLQGVSLAEGCTTFASKGKMAVGRTGTEFYDNFEFQGRLMTRYPGVERSRTLS